MAKRQKREIRCTVEYTEGCDRRLTEALVDIYYRRLRGIGKAPEMETREEAEAPA